MHYQASSFCKGKLHIDSNQFEQNFLQKQAERNSDAVYLQDFKYGSNLMQSYYEALSLYPWN